MADEQDVVVEVSAKEAVEAALAQRVAEEPGFLAELVLDPEGAVGPLVTEALGDDGELDLSGVSVSIHVETDRHLHFTVRATERQLADVGGFAMGGLSGLLGSTRVRMPGRTLGRSDSCTNEATGCLTGARGTIAYACVTTTIDGCP